MEISRNPTRPVRIGSVTIGNGNPIAVQSMCATRTQNVDATVAQINELVAVGADIIRIAVDNRKDVAALSHIRAQVPANLTVDLQESYRLAGDAAPHVNKIRYNPGHLYHHERKKPWQEKVRYLAEVAREHDCAMRVGVNCGSVDPALRTQPAADQSCANCAQLQGNEGDEWRPCAIYVGKLVNANGWCSVWVPKA